MDLNILKRCDGIYMFGNYQRSKGAMIELSYAYDNNIPILIDKLEQPEKLTVEQFRIYVIELQRDLRRIYNDK